MTRARALKQAIRARAARTGERYTTARSLVPRSGKVSVVVTNSKLADTAMVEERRALWRTALGALAKSFPR